MISFAHNNPFRGCGRWWSQVATAI